MAQHNPNHPTLALSFENAHVRPGKHDTNRHTRRVALILLFLAVVGVSLFYTQWYLSKDAMSALRHGQYERAAQFLLPAAQKGHPHAQTLLGNLHYLGLGTTQNYTEAAHWYEKAAMSGDSAAQLNRALLHLQGLGQDQDDIAAVAWFLVADASGDQRAELYLRRLSGSLNPNKIQQANRLYEQLRRDQANTTN